MDEEAIRPGEELLNDAYDAGQDDDYERARSLMAQFDATGPHDLDLLARRHVLAALLAERDDPATMRAELEAALGYAEEADDDWERGRIFVAQARDLARTGDVEGALALLRRADALYDLYEEPEYERCHVRINVVKILDNAGRSSEAIDTVREAVDLMGQAGDTDEQHSFAEDLARRLQKLKRHSEAIDAWQEAARLAQEIGNQPHRAYAITQMAFSEAALEQLDDALAHLFEGHRLFVEAKDQLGAGLAGGQLASFLLLHDKGTPEQVSALLSESAQRLREAGHEGGVAETEKLIDSVNEVLAHNPKAMA